MPFGPAAFRTAIMCFSTLVPGCVHAEGIDTEHLFGFMIGTDVGSAGEREFQSQTTGRFSKSGGNYRAINQELELEVVPAKVLRIAANWLGKVFPLICATGFWIAIPRPLV